MKYEEIIRLLDAGYSREEIMSMQETPADPQQDPPADPQQDPPADPPQDDMKLMINEMRDAFAEMKKEITALNIMTSRQPPEDVKTGEDILASIINPTNIKKTI